MREDPPAELAGLSGEWRPMATGSHISVSCEACDALLPERGGVLVDGTFGRGGHSRELLRRMPADARLVAIDRDAAAAVEATTTTTRDSYSAAAHFSELARVLAGLGMGGVDGILLDIGVSSPQLDDAARGFSFMRDGPLDMRMDQACSITAAEWIAAAAVDELAG